MDRRRFTGSLGMATLGWMPVGRTAWALAGEKSPVQQKKLVVAMLRGAVDGLNVVVPYADRDYYRVRPSIAVPKPGAEGGAIDLNGYFGLHPSLLALQPLWQQKRLAFVHSAGSPDPSRSHFDAQDYLETGTPGKKGTPDGWMNRLLSTLPGEQSPSRTISFGTVTPRILSGAAPVANVGSSKSVRRPRMLDQAGNSRVFEQLYKDDSTFARLYREGQSARRDVLEALNAEMDAADRGAPSSSAFPQDAATLASMMRRNPAIQMGFFALGGWDTHANQGGSTGQLANRLEPLGRGLAALAENLGPLFEETVVVVMSEFGRTVRQNGNNGTDHGHGNAMWIMGGRIKGQQVYGDWQGLAESRLYEGRDLPVTTDFRAVIAQILQQHMRLKDHQLERVFPGYSAPRESLKMFI